jgi:hypothetical protein
MVVSGHPKGTESGSRVRRQSNKWRVSCRRYLWALGAFAFLTTVNSSSARAQEIQTVFVIAMENQNWTRPANYFSGGIQQIYQNPKRAVYQQFGERNRLCRDRRTLGPHQ